MARLLLNETSNRAFTLFSNIHIRRRTTMNTVLNRIDRLMMAVTFAEANEHEMAQEFLPCRKASRNNRTNQTARMTGGQVPSIQTTH